MTLNQMSNAIGALLNKDQSALYQNNTDLVLLALDNARAWADRSHDFRVFSQRLILSINYSNPFDFPPNMKKLRQAYLLSDNYTSGPITIESPETAWRRSKYYAPNLWNSFVDTPTTYGELSMVNLGNGTGFIFPNGPSSNYPTPLQVTIDFFAFSAPYLGQMGTYTDFYLSEGQDWLMYRASRDLLMREASGDKIPAQLQALTKMEKDAWDSMITYDVSVNEGSYDMSLR